MQEHWQPTLQSVGSLVATNGIHLSTEVNGTVSEIVFKSGQRVEQGDILVRLDDAVDEAALQALRAESKLAQVQFNRSKDLLKKKSFPNLNTMKRKHAIMPRVPEQNSRKR